MNGTRLINACESLLKLEGYNEFERPNNSLNIRPFKVDYNETLMYELIMGNDNVYSILERRFFPYIEDMTPNTIFPKSFKRFFSTFFFTEYWNRELRYETLDICISKLASSIITDMTTISYLYNNFEKFITNENQNISKSDSENLAKTRSLFRTLPQTVATININDDIVTTADSNDLMNASNNGSGKTSSISNNFDINNLMAIMNLFKQVFKTWCDPIFSRVMLH